MKKIVMLLCMVPLCIAGAKAQQGTPFVYGGVKMSSVKTGNAEASTNGQLALGAVYNITNNLSAGIEVDYSASKAIGYKQNEFQVGPLVRYTVPFNDTFGFWGQANVHYVTGKTQLPSNPSETNANGFNGFITPAFYANMGRGWGLNLVFGSLGYKTVKSDNVSTSTFTAGFGPTNWGIVLSKGF